MKTVRNKKTGEIRRLPNDAAHKLVSSGHWEFIPKSVWKIQIRDKKLEGK